MVGSRVYVGGLPYGTRERDLEKFFKGYGRTRDILIKNGYGFVEFEDYRDADDAVYELNGKELLGERQVAFVKRNNLTVINTGLACVVISVNFFKYSKSINNVSLCFVSFHLAGLL